MFIRSASGLNNQHLFFNVDFVLYTEGGSVSYNIDDVLDGKFSELTDDIVFWDNLFDQVNSDIKVKCKSVGSKENVKHIAEKIIEENLSSVIAAMDSEHDHILNLRLTHKNILYTYGYSWENDVWDLSVVKDIIFQISAIQINDNDIDENFSRLIQMLRPMVCADVKLFPDNKSFFPKKGKLSSVNCQPDYLPYLIEDKIQKQFVEYKIEIEEIIKYGEIMGIDPHRNCYGHFLADYCYQLIINYIKKRCNLGGITKDIVNRMAINKYFTNYFQNKLQFQYYSSNINDLISA